jgi:hypothetical protein
MTGRLRDLHGHAAGGCVDPLGLVAVGVALALRSALVESCAQEPLALELHRQFERAGEHARDVVRPACDQLFQEGLNRRTLPLVHAPSPMGVW